MLIHQVFFWLRDPQSENDRVKLIAGLKTLKQVKTIKQMHIGIPAPTEQRGVVDNSYSVSELMFFEDLEGQAAYQEDPIHQQFVKDCSSLWTKVVVYDSMIV
jgi:hypothetical protein